MRPVRTASQLDLHRSAVGNDDQFVQRCQDGFYGPFVGEVAIAVIAEDISDGAEATAADLADAILAEMRQTKKDALPAVA